MLPRSGDVLYIGRAASVQFMTRPFLFRVIRNLNLDTYEGWVWLDGYEMNDAGDAVERRSIFVQAAGLRVAVQASDRRPRNQGNHAIAVPSSRTAGDVYARPSRPGPTRAGMTNRI